MTEPPAAADDCEHAYETRLLGGHPITVRACILCRTPDWNDLMEQAVDLYRWGRQEGRAGTASRATLSAYGRPRDDEQPARTTRNNPPTSDNTLHELRTWLATERAKAQAADRPDCDPALLITPHNGIAAGLSIALGWVNHRLGEALDSGPTVAEAAADDRRWFNSEKEGA